MRLALILLFLILGYQSSDAQECFVVSGTVRDAVSNEPLVGANIYLKAIKKGQVSRRDGSFSMELPVRDGPLVITFSYVGYQSRVIALKEQRDTVLSVTLDADNTLPDVNVVGYRGYFGASSSQMSAVGISGSEVRKMPSFMGEADLMKALQYIPGVQSSGEGHAGINVRGGNHDENQILLDGIPIYDAEHLKGFVSALNPVLVQDVTFYKGAFPARYGGQLSSVIDMHLKDGDPKHYSAEIGMGLISSHLNVEGPIDGKSSFFLAGRYSYFQTFAIPIYERIAKSRELVTPYANLNYYDLTARLSRRWNDGRSVLTALFYIGSDKDDTSPTASSNTYKIKEGSTDYSCFQHLENTTRNNWGNVLGGIKWRDKLSENASMETLLSYSRYHYLMEETEHSGFLKTRDSDGLTEEQTMETSLALHSLIQEIRGQWDAEVRTGRHGRWQYGIQYSGKNLKPVYDIYSHTETCMSGYTRAADTDTIIGMSRKLHTVSLYTENSRNWGERLSMALGVRLTGYFAPGKNYQSLEPRASISMQIASDMSLKLSLAYMSQGIHQLSSSNLMMPSDVWIPSSRQIPLTTSKQLAMGYSWDMGAGLNLSLEGYYKKMDNLLEYRDGASFSKADEALEDMTVLGEGSSYGLEFLLQKHSGRLTGWLGYTWSKSLRSFDRPGQELNGGNSFYAANDCRNNLGAVLNYKFSRYLDVSASWTYQTGRRGNISTTACYVNMPNQWEHGTSLKEITLWGTTLEDWRDVIKKVDAVPAFYYFSGSGPLKEQYIHTLRMVYTYKQRNGFMLPSCHHLDFSVNFHIPHVLAESIISLSLYNVYNRKNITQVYRGYVNNRIVLKGISQFPFMPSLQYALKF